MAEKLTTYDPAAALVDDEEIAAFMADAFETGDAAYIAHALGIVARATGMTDCPRYRPVPRTALPLVQRSPQPDAQNHDGRDDRSEERRVGKECVRKCRSRGTQLQ